MYILRNTQNDAYGSEPSHLNSFSPKAYEYSFPNNGNGFEAKKTQKCHRYSFNFVRQPVLILKIKVKGLADEKLCDQRDRFDL